MSFFYIDPHHCKGRHINSGTCVLIKPAFNMTTVHCGDQTLSFLKLSHCSIYGNHEHVPVFMGESPLYTNT